jgi:hypothetical protein
VWRKDALSASPRPHPMSLVADDMATPVDEPGSGSFLGVRGGT